MTNYFFHESEFLFFHTNHCAYSDFRNYYTMLILPIYQLNYIMYQNTTQFPFPTLSRSRQIFSKNFVKWPRYIKKAIVVAYWQARVFTKKFSSKVEVELQVQKLWDHSAQCGNFENLLSRTLFWQKFRESNGITKEITKQLIWRFFFCESNFFVFPWINSSPS